MNREGIKRALPRIGIAALLALIACDNDSDHCGCGIGQGNHWSSHGNEYRNESTGTVSIDAQRVIDIPQTATTLETNWYDPQSTSIAIWVRTEIVDGRPDAGASGLIDAANGDAADADAVAPDASDAQAVADGAAEDGAVEPPVTVDAPTREPYAELVLVTLRHRPPIGTTDLGALGGEAMYCKHATRYRSGWCVDLSPEIRESLTGSITVTGVYAESTTEHGGGALANFHYELDVPASAGRRLAIRLQGDVSSYESDECL